MRIFSLYDIKAQSWLTPFFSRTNGTAFREIQMTLSHKDDSNMLSAHPEDFELWFIGTFVDGVLAAELPVKLGSVADISVNN